MTLERCDSNSDERLQVGTESRVVNQNDASARDDLHPLKEL